jgi:hypothetical protein
VNVELLTESRKKVEQELISLREIFKQDGKKRKDALYRDLQKVYGHLQHGKKIIDLFEAMKKGGLNQDGDPKLAIARADLKQIYCHKNERGGCMFSQYESSWNRHKGTKISGDLTIPEGTFTCDSVYSAPERGKAENPELLYLMGARKMGASASQGSHPSHSSHS